jgi:hypothetical protein
VNDRAHRTKTVAQFNKLRQDIAEWAKIEKIAGARADQLVERALWRGGGLSPARPASLQHPCSTR